MDPITIVLAVGGLAAGYAASTVITKQKVGSAQEQAEKELKNARRDAGKLLDEARDEASKMAEASRKEEKTRRHEFKEIEQRLVGREESLDRKLDDLDKRTEKLRKAESEVKLG